MLTRFFSYFIFVWNLFGKRGDHLLSFNFLFWWTHPIRVIANHRRLAQTQNPFSFFFFLFLTTETKIVVRGNLSWAEKKIFSLFLIYYFKLYTIIRRNKKKNVWQIHLQNNNKLFVLIYVTSDFLVFCSWDTCYYFTQQQIFFFFFL